MGRWVVRTSVSGTRVDYTMDMFLLLVRCERYRMVYHLSLGTVPLRTGTTVAVHVLFMPQVVPFFRLLLYIESFFVAYFVVTG